MDDLVNRLARELPGTDTSRYDIAYRRGRAQARSSLLFGGLALGSVAGALTMFLLDPIEGRSRRAALGQRIGALGNDLRRTAQGRGADLRNRAIGAATELGLPGTPPSNEELRAEREQESPTGIGATRNLSSLTPRSAGAPGGVPLADPDEERTPVGATTADRDR
jgi:hypothetical protein